MKLTLEEARSLCAQLDEASALCEKSLQVVKSHEGLGMLNVYARLVGMFLGHSYTNVLAGVWKQFPELEPAAMKQPFQEPVPIMSRESQDAIDAFLRVADPALETARALLAQGQLDSLPFGGLPEVSNSVAEIREFREHPRFVDPEQREEHEP